MQRHVQRLLGMRLLVLGLQAYIQPLGTARQQTGCLAEGHLVDHRCLEQGEEILAIQAQYHAGFDQGDGGVTRLIRQQGLLAEAGPDLQLGQHLATGVAATEYLGAATLEEIAAVARLTLDQHTAAGRQVDWPQAIEHGAHIGRRYLGEQRILQQALQPLDIVAVAAQIEQQVVVGQAPGEQTTEVGRVEHQYAGVAQRTHLVLTRQARRQRVAAGFAAGLQTLLAAGGIAQQQLAGQQVIGGTGLIALAEQQLAGQQVLRHQLWTQLAPLLLG